MNKSIQILGIAVLITGNTHKAMNNPCNPEQKLINAAYIGNQTFIQQLLTQDTPVDARNKDDRTALMISAWGGHTDICKLLIDHHASINAQDKYGSTALIRAAWKGNTSTCKLLIDNKALTNIATENTRTALMYAAQRGHTEICELLINSNALINTKDKNGDTALIKAAWKGNIKTCKLLIGGIIKPIKEMRAQSIALIGIKKVLKPELFKLIDLNIMKLIAALVNAPAIQLMRDLFAQIDTIKKMADQETLADELKAYIQEQLEQ